MSRKMQRSIGKWLNWKTGVGVLAVLLIAALILQFTIGWGEIIRSIFGTAGPEGGQTCLPTCNTGDQEDGRFLMISNSGEATFAGRRIVVWVTVPADWGTFELGIFDGDSGKDNNGNINLKGGNWDDTTTEATYTLYADPAKNGLVGQQVAQWMGQSMPNNAWFNQTLNQDPRALTPDKKNYIYRLEVTQPIQSGGLNGFKLRSTGWMSAGRASLVNAELAFMGALMTMPDFNILYPQNQGLTKPGVSKYNGDWQWYFYLPTNTVTLEIWDGDFDRGSYNGFGLDTDDPNTVGKPSWASADTQDEGIGGTYLGNPGRGAPADNASKIYYRIGDPVWYEIVNPAGVPIFQNGNPGNPNEPSGTEEWEKYLITADTGQFPVPTAADAECSVLQPGMYHWDIHGLDLHNIAFIRTDYEVCPAGDCPPPPWCDTECSCPRTIGYWKNNVKKILEGKPKGIQETRESLEWALRNIALVSPLYRHGLNVANPVPISDPTPLTLEEANAILQKAAGNTMLDRALQQNLATWLNLGSSKIGYNVTTSLDGIAGGHYEGSMWDALNYAQNIILYQRGDAGLLERAKDIADMINNGALNGDPAERSCSDANYQQQFPPAKQPPKHQNMPKQPKHPEPPAPVVGCEPPRTNQYGVESPTNNPFYGIKFEYQSGTEIRDGGFDEFRYTLPADVVNGMTAIQLEAKAGEIVGQGTLDGCQFNAFTPCDRTLENNGFLFTFHGAVDNGDGTMTLTFTIQNMNGYGLSHATFGLPDGVVPSNPSGGYQSEVCP